MASGYGPEIGRWAENGVQTLVAVLLKAPLRCFA
jgi:hypothetical protein